MQDIWDKFWKDDKGHVVIWQWPNIWLIGWAVLTFVSLIFNGNVSKILMWTGEVSLLVWCLFEIFKGVNYFRRLLGLVVLSYLVMTVLKGLN